MSLTRAELSKKLGEAMLALRCADSALVAQFEETIRLQNKVSEIASPVPARPTFSEVVRTLPTIVLKPEETLGGDDRDYRNPGNPIR